VELGEIEVLLLLLEIYINYHLKRQLIVSIGLHQILLLNYTKSENIITKYIDYDICFCLHYSRYDLKIVRREKSNTAFLIETFSMRVVDVRKIYGFVLFNTIESGAFNFHAFHYYSSTTIYVYTSRRSLSFLYK
jgi:hypothetical protein